MSLTFCNYKLCLEKKLTFATQSVLLFSMTLFALLKVISFGVGGDVTFEMRKTNPFFFF